MQVRTRGVFYETDPVRKAANIKNAIEVDFPFFLSALNKLLEQNGTGFLVGKAITLADLSWYVPIKGLTVGNPVALPSDFLNNYPKVQEWVNLIEHNPKIKAWNESHPNNYKPAIKLTYFAGKG